VYVNKRRGRQRQMKREAKGKEMKERQEKGKRERVVHA
jgi:hypothetical protein